MHDRRIRGTALGVACLCCLAVVGCGPRRPPMAPAKGKITVEGKPIKNAAVLFIPVAEEGRPASGNTDEQGQYQLSTFDKGDGAILGRYIVTVTLMDLTNPTGAPVVDENGLEASAVIPKITWIIPPRYSQPKTSGMEAEVTADKHDFAFDLMAK